MRCRPQSFCTWLLTITSPTMSSVRGSLGSALTCTDRKVPESFDTHSAVSKPGTLTNGVETLRSGVTQGFGAAADDAMKRPFDKYACNWPLPPRSAAGFTHAAAMFSPCALPNRELAGGGIVSLKAAYATAQPVCDADLHSGMFWNAPTS